MSKPKRCFFCEVASGNHTPQETTHCVIHWQHTLGCGVGYQCGDLKNCHSANFCPIACEQRVESIITAADSLVRRHLTIWLDAMFQAEQLPARVADLNTWLTKT